MFEAAVMTLDVVLGAAVALFLLVYMTYALIWPEKL
jgi:K+-transporting ATPase KdpF subunit